MPGSSSLCKSFSSCLVPLYHSMPRGELIQCPLCGDQHLLPICQAPSLRPTMVLQLLSQLYAGPDPSSGINGFLRQLPVALSYCPPQGLSGYGPDYALSCGVLGPSYDLLGWQMVSHPFSFLRHRSPALDPASCLEALVPTTTTGA